MRHTVFDVEIIDFRPGRGVECTRFQRIQDGIDCFICTDTNIADTHVFRTVRIVGCNAVNDAAVAEQLIPICGLIVAVAAADAAAVPDLHE